MSDRIERVVKNGASSGIGLELAHRFVTEGTSERTLSSSTSTRSAL